jgi:hypothetical protein
MCCKLDSKSKTLSQLRLQLGPGDLCSSLWLEKPQTVEFRLVLSDCSALQQNRGYCVRRNGEDANAA